jgi:hypothetical protein
VSDDYSLIHELNKLIKSQIYAKNIDMSPNKKDSFSGSIVMDLINNFKIEPREIKLPDDTQGRISHLESYIADTKRMIEISQQYGDTQAMAQYSSKLYDLQKELKELNEKQ